VPLARALRRFPLKKAFDLVDAAYWGWNDLGNASALMALVGQSAALEYSTGSGPLRSNPMNAFRQRSSAELQRSRSAFLDHLIEKGEEPRRGMHSGAEHQAAMINAMLEGIDE
jgi:hypothetical protein